MSEKIVMDANHVRMSREGYRLFRNNVGKGWTGKSIRIEHPMSIVLSPGDVVIRSARRIHYGLLKGSGDLIGYRTVIITPDMVGSKLAVFSTVEQKIKKRKRTPEQIQWHDVITDAGGFALLLED